MDSRDILERQACKTLMKKVGRLLETKICSGISSMLSLCRLERETELDELGLGNLLLLLWLKALSEEDTLLLALVSELSRDFAPLDSAHLAAWIEEDYEIPRLLLDQAARSARQSSSIQLPGSLLRLTALHSSPLSPDVVRSEEPSGIASTPAMIEVEAKHEEPEDGETKLVKAVLGNDRDAVERLVAEGGDVNRLSVGGESLLHLAVKGGAKEAVRDLLRLGARVNRRDRERMTPLYYAVAQDCSEMVAILLDSGADPNIRLVGGQTLLMFALSVGSLSAAETLLSRGVLVDELNDDGVPAIFVAANPQEYRLAGKEAVGSGKYSSEKTVAAVRLLCKYKDYVKVKNIQGNTVLHLAARNADCSLIQLLLDSGAELDARNCKGQTPLHSAVEAKSLAAVEKLIRLQADVNCKNNAGQAPLHIAVSSGLIDIVDLLLEHNATVDATDEKGYTPLCLAAEEGRIELVEMLAKERANVNHRLNDGTPVLCCAASDSKCFYTLRKLGALCSGKDFRPAVERGCVELLDLLEEDAVVDVNVRDGEGNTALHWAAAAGKEAAVSWVLDRGVGVNTKGRYDRTPLHLAAEKGHLPVVGQLLDRGADIGSRDSYGWTPLHEAAWGGHLPVVSLLVDRGADIGSRTSNGYTPLSLSRCNNRQAVSAFLESKGAR